ncbi:MAG: MSMEG_4193 family putative phosphomutase [Anaerolineae bacterium]|nr:MSMEG_4193 family putative phosphomutase [Caldilineales bacterium]MDW8267777.1 MSMEG_4193 family putative phosphomutase [Anaerolineae bacterium]
MSATLLLVRHGENDLIKARRLAGRLPGVHLNETGREQARRLAERLAAWPLAAVYSSPLERCYETALIIAEPHGLPVRTHDGLLESDYGEWQGQAVDELVKTDLWKLVQMTPSFVRFPGGETLRAMQQRTVETLHEIAADHPQRPVVVCSHADPIRAALMYFLGASLDLFQRLEIAPASLSIVRFEPFGPRVLRINDTGRLDPPAAEPDPVPPSDQDPHA